jgi:glycosyltransferase involved in cell wall biosynthesis
MEIVVAHNFYQQAGGEDACVAAEVAMLRSRGHSVTQYCLHNDSIDSMGHLQLACRTIWSQTSYRELRRLFQARRPQVAHFHNTFPLMSPAVYYAARAENVGVVQTLHNFRLTCVNALLFRDGNVCESCLGKAFAWQGVVRKCYRDSRSASTATAAMVAVHRVFGTWKNVIDAYIALSESSRCKIVQGGIAVDKVSVKPNFVYPDPGPGAGNGGYAVYVGRLSAEKGIETLLAAWRQLPDIPIKLIGNGPLAAAVREAAANNRAIEWLQSMSRDAVYDLIGDAAFLVLPSRCYENFPRVVIEAYAKGTPVIASKLGAMEEIVDDGGTGLHFRPGDPDDLVAKVRAILAEPNRLQCMRALARRIFEQKFTAAINHEMLMAVYERARESLKRRRAGHLGDDVRQGV